MPGRFDALIQQLGKLNQLFHNAPTQPLKNKHQYHYINPLPMLHWELALTLNALCAEDLSLMNEEEWTALNRLLFLLIPCQQIDWNKVKRKEFMPLFHSLLKITLHTKNPASASMLHHFYQRDDIDWNFLFINDSGFITSYLFYFLEQLEHPAILKTLNSLVLIKGLNWGFETADKLIKNKTPLYLLLCAFEHTHNAINILVKHRPLKELPFLQPLVVKRNENAKRAISVATIQCIEDNFYSYFDDVAEEEYNHYLMVVLAERIQNAALCKRYVDKIPVTSKLFKNVQIRLFHLLLNSVRIHQVHHPDHSPQQKLAIKQNNAARREDLYAALEAALAIPLEADREVYSTMVAVKYLDGKGGVKSFPSEYDDPYINCSSNKNPWNYLIREGRPPIVRQYLDTIRMLRKQIKLVIDLEDRLEALRISMSCI